MSREPPPPRSAFAAWQAIDTRWADNDSYGHVNNTVHYQWFDTAVNRWMIEQGMLDIAAGDPIALVVETSCRFHAPLAFPQRVDIGLRVAELGRSSVRYRIGIFAEGADLAAADGQFVHVVVDRATRRPIAIPGDWRTRMQALA